MAIYYHGDRDRRFAGALQSGSAPEISGPIHVGTLAQAVMRACGGPVLRFEVDNRKLKTQRKRDAGDFSRKEIELMAARFEKKGGINAIIYLNRYEGIPGDIFRAANEQGIDIDSLSDMQFRKLIPEAGESLILLDPSLARFAGFEPGYGAAQESSAGGQEAFHAEEEAGPMPLSA